MASLYRDQLDGSISPQPGRPSDMKMSKDRDTRKQQRNDSSPRIIHVSSFRMLQSDPNQESYASTKAGLTGLTHSMAVSLSEFGIRVNLIAPGRIKVKHESKEGDEKGEQWKIEGDDAEKHAANRAGMPEDIAECAEWLIGAGFTTGQSITIDGGAIMQKREEVVFPSDAPAFSI
jgi:NAD(P)-dependent dehydrogenase (short-subunit alcohol dehydrogenase family)